MVSMNDLTPNLTALILIFEGLYASPRREPKTVFTCESLLTDSFMHECLPRVPMRGVHKADNNRRRA